MGFFEKIFGKGEPKAEKKAAETFLFLRGYTPVFTDFAGSIYERELIRAALDAHGRHAMKLAPNIVGSAKEGEGGAKPAGAQRQSALRKRTAVGRARHAGRGGRGGGVE